MQLTRFAQKNFVSSSFNLSKYKVSPNKLIPLVKISKSNFKFSLAEP